MMLHAWASVVIVILGLIVALQVFKARAKQAEANIKRQEDRAESAEAVVESKTTIERAVERIEEQQRERQKTDEEAIKTGDRSQLDNDW